MMYNVDKPRNLTRDMDVVHRRYPTKANVVSHVTVQQYHLYHSRNLYVPILEASKAHSSYCRS